MKKTLNLLVLMLLALFAASCSHHDDDPNEQEEEITMYVSDQTGTRDVLSKDGIKTSVECLLVKFDDNSDNWEPLKLNNIKGFTYTKGYCYQLLVKKNKLTNPPADRYDYTYTLVTIIYSWPVKEDNPKEEITSESQIEYQELCPYNKYKLYRNCYTIDDNGIISSPEHPNPKSYEEIGRIYIDNIMDKADSNWSKFNQISYQGYFIYVISPLDDKIRLIHSDMTYDGPLFKQVVPETEFEQIKAMKPGTELQYRLILANIYKKGLQKLELTIRKQ